MCARILAALALLAAQDSAGGRIEVHVDPRIELLTAVARMAGFDEFNASNSASPYATEVEKQFGPFREHAVVARLKELRASSGVSYDAIASLAVHLDGLPGLEERAPFDEPLERLDARWGGAKARDFLVELREFVAASHAVEFFDSHRAFYAEVERRLGERLSQSQAIPWFDAFFGARPEARYTAVPGLLCGGGNYGVGVRFSDGRPEEITPVFGCWKWDDGGVPVFDEGYLPLFIHELCHSYTNRYVDRFEQQLAKSGTAIHAAFEAQMRRQAYGTWQTMLYESLVRASVVRCRRATEGEAKAAEQERYEVSRSFEWVPGLADLLGNYEADRGTYTTFDEFMPRVVEYFEAYAKDLPARTASAPHVVSIEPANGATGVDPSITRLVIRFDREMDGQGWSIVGSKEDQPEFTGGPSYDESHKVLTVPMRLAAGRTYRLSLNNDVYRAFRTKEGVPLEPLEVTFTTRP